MSGGGNIPVGGGALAKAALYGLVRVSDNFALSVEGGLATSTGAGRFRAESVGVGVVWAFDAPAGGQHLGARGAQRLQLRRRGLQRGAPRRQHARLQADVLKIDRFVTPNVLPHRPGPQRLRRRRRRLLGGADRRGLAAASRLATARRRRRARGRFGRRRRRQPRLHRPSAGLRRFSGDAGDRAAHRRRADQGGEGSASGNVVNATVTFTYGVSSGG